MNWHPLFALATITAAALVAPPSLVHAAGALNGHNLNGITLNGITLNGIKANGMTLNGLTLNGLTLNGLTLNGVERAGREVYFVGEQAGGESSTVLSIELPRVTR